MPRPASNDSRNLMGKRVKVPAGLKGYCDPRWGGCGLWSETDGTETAIAELDKHWNGRFFASLGWMAFFLPCVNSGCDRKVQYETKIWVGTL